MALIHVNFFSETLGMSSQLEVVLPQRAAGQIGVGQAEEGREIPVLYLLHGMTDNHTTWGRNTCIERYASELGFAVVMPNGHLGWYTDMKNGYNYYTYIAHEVPAVCERFFPRLSRRREGRFVAGNSMGGYGAVKLALSRPDFFRAAASLSGGLDVTDTVRRRESGFRANLWEDIFGPADEVAGSENDLFALAEKIAREGRVQDAPKLWLWCGTEDFLYHQKTKMRDHLNALGFAPVWREEPGDHSWRCWEPQLPAMLGWMNAIWKGE